MTAPAKGDVWLANLNPRLGTEPGKVRPVVVVQTDLLNPHHTSTLVCPVTSKVGGAGNILRVRLHKGEGGAKKDSDVMVDQIRAVDNRRLMKWIGRMPRGKEEELGSKIRSIFDLE